MILVREKNGLRATVPCKVNLFLEVLGKRPDGYHELDTVMMALSLTDEIHITRRDDSEIRLQIEFPEGAGIPLDGEDLAWSIPSDSTNLIVRALHRLRQVLGKPDEGMDVVLKKRIPAMAGLGGGSADCAAALVLGALHWQKPFANEPITSIASELGSDINFFIEAYQNGFWLARCSGRGERIQPLACHRPLHFVIAHPPRGCSTKEVFDSLRTINETQEVSKRTPDFLIESLQQGDTTAIGGELFNRLEEPAMRTTEWILSSRRQLDRYNHHGQSLSGSGSARFCLCESTEQAEKIAREIQQQGLMRAFSASSWQSPGMDEQAKSFF
ncbi:MAG: 4-(cytidine 5'-diphospho)-2-C-methyl-D-erythritol kinase [Pirellula sp.]